MDGNDIKSNQEIYTEVGRTSDRIVGIVLDSQKEQRATAVAQEGRIGSLEVDFARLSSAITNLLEGFAGISKHFEEQATTLAGVLARLVDVEEFPRLTEVEVEHIRREQRRADAAFAAQQKARLDLGISIKAGIILAVIGFVFTVLASVITLIILSPHVHGF